MGSSTEGPRASVHVRPLHPCPHTPHTLSSPTGSSTEGHSATVHMRPPAHFGTTLTHFVAPW
eukprot:1324158-Pyramimonas_sp.AAC.1